MVSYAQLNQTHPSCDTGRSALLAALYEGGDKLDALKTSLLPQRSREPTGHYVARLKESEYRNYLGPIIDYFRSMLFQSRPILKATLEGSAEPLADAGEYWNDLRDDCDRGGTNLDAFFGLILTDAMTQRTGWLRLHQPDDGGIPAEDAAAYDARGLGNIWLERIEPGALLDWESDESGRLLWAVVHKSEQRRMGLAASRNVTTETWWYLTPESTETYRVQYEKGNEPKPEDEIPMAGTPTLNRFGAVPLACLDLPPALWIANRLRSPQLALFRKVSALAWSLSATAYAMPVASVSDPAEYLKQVSGAGYEIVIGQNDKYEWAAPPTGHFDAFDREIKASKDELFRIAHQMAMGVDNNAAAVGRTAESKASDVEITRVVLAAFSRAVKETIERTLDMISVARGENYGWSVEGLDDFASFDIGAFLTQLGLTDKIGGIPSKTFQVYAKTRAAESLLKDADESVKAKIRKEIADGTVDPVEQAQQDREAALGLFAPPSGAERPGEPAAKPPVPASGGGGRSPIGQKPPGGQAAS